MISVDEIRSMIAASGLNQAKFAEQIGTAQSTVSRWLSGAQVPDPQLEERLRAFAASASGAGNYRAPIDLFGQRDLPIYSAVEGGTGELIVDLEPIDYVARPWYLGQVREAFGMVVTGESMVPAYEPGNIVIVNPKLPPMRGKDHIFRTAEDNGDFRASIKRLVKWNNSEWIVEQFNPPEGKTREFSFAREEWVKALRVVGKYDG